MDANGLEEGDQVVFRHLEKEKAGEIWNVDARSQTASIFVSKENCLYTSVPVKDIKKTAAP